MISKYLSNLTSKTLFLVVILCSVSAVTMAQTSEKLYESANTLYQKESYQEALDIYKKIEAQDSASVGLYYNMANTYYKLNQVAPSIYYYEKTLSLDPNNKDASYNLAFAQRMTIDKIDVLPKTFLQRIDQNYIKIIKFDTWAIMAISASILFVLLFLSYYFSYVSTRKRLYFITAILALITTLFSFAFAYKGYDFAQNNKPAIIFEQSASVKDAPTPNSTEVFELHEGTKVFVLEQVGTWQKIKLADGKIGWISKTDLKAL
ncbi:MAG: SH3 domain-containing protein [Flavobacteriales bacterium]|nr:SH3 domain-containing protein [Flavobacteriales bacterium]